MQEQVFVSLASQSLFEQDEVVVRTLFRYCEQHLQNSCCQPIPLFALSMYNLCAWVCDMLSVAFILIPLMSGTFQMTTCLKVRGQSKYGGCAPVLPRRIVNPAPAVFPSTSHPQFWMLEIAEGLLVSVMWELTACKDWELRRYPGDEACGARPFFVYGLNRQPI